VFIESIVLKMIYSTKNLLVLTLPESLRYLKDKQFRQEMQKKAGIDEKSGRYLISLSLCTTYTYMDGKGVMHYITRFGDELTDISGAENVCKVDLGDQVLLTDISPLQNVGEVDLTSCFEIRNFDAVSGPGRILIVKNCQSDQEEGLRKAMARGTTVITDM
jgi:hypothetical protein